MRNVTGGMPLSQGLLNSEVFNPAYSHDTSPHASIMSFPSKSSVGFRLYAAMNLVRDAVPQQLASFERIAGGSFRCLPMVTTVTTQILHKTLR